MTDRRPDRNYAYVNSLKSAIFTSQAGYERRRQISRRSKRTFNFAFSSVRGVYNEALQNFYNSRGGDYESFEFDLSYAGQSGTMIARFNGDLNIVQILATDNPLTDVYNVTFSLQETFS
jgi:hypothetical protein